MNPKIAGSRAREAAVLVCHPRTTSTKLAVSVVVPCFNEAEMLPHLAGVLADVKQSLDDNYELQFVFVDDGSEDDTWPLLQQHFGSRADCTLVRQPQNMGIAAAILSGISNSTNEIVCSIDSDCTYDPHELKNIISLLADDVHMVTASPYHRRGQVLGVPPWRLSLSKAASFLYRCVLRQKLSTYTSCFRVYRKSALKDLQLSEYRYAGIAEMLGRLDLNGARIVEYPTTLRVRTVGHSKMKVLITILGQLRVLARLLAVRLHQDASKTAAPAKTTETVS